MLTFCLCLFISGVLGSTYDLNDAEMLFEDFIKTHNKKYDTKEKAIDRYHIFKENLKTINRQNEAQERDDFGVTKFSDLSLEEFQNTYTKCLVLNDNTLRNDELVEFTEPHGKVPEEFDWRDHIGLTKVKNQRHCGACWAFSATGNIESQYTIKHHRTISLSEQQIISCDKSDGACMGGSTETAFKWLMHHDGLQLEDDYPYKGHNGTCYFDSTEAIVQVTGYKRYRLSNEEQLKQLLHNHGPLSIGIDSSLLHNFGGHKVLVPGPNDCSHQIDHALLLVGYGTEGDVPFWIIKNSWGPKWAEDGYFRLVRGRKACGLLKYTTTAYVE